MSTKQNKILIIIFFAILHPLSYLLLNNWQFLGLPLRLEAVVLTVSLFFGWEAIIGSVVGFLGINGFVYLLGFKNFLPWQVILIDSLIFASALVLTNLYCQKSKNYFASSFILSGLLFVFFSINGHFHGEKWSYVWFLLVVNVININVIGYLAIEGLNKIFKKTSVVQK